MIDDDLLDNRLANSDGLINFDTPLRKAASELPRPVVDYLVPPTPAQAAGGIFGARPAGYFLDEIPPSDAQEVILHRMGVTNPEEIRAALYKALRQPVPTSVIEQMRMRGML